MGNRTSGILRRAKPRHRLAQCSGVELQTCASDTRSIPAVLSGSDVLSASAVISGSEVDSGSAVDSEVTAQSAKRNKRQQETRTGGIFGFLFSFVQRHVFFEMVNASLDLLSDVCLCGAMYEFICVRARKNCVFYQLGSTSLTCRS